MPLLRIDPERRRRGRLWLYGGLGLLVAVLLLATWLLRRATPSLLDDLWTAEQLADHPDVMLLRDYARIDTSADTGSELAGARFLAERLEEAGLEAHVERLGSRSANLWAVVEGRRPEALVLHSHIDVFPILRPERWTRPPFGAEIDGVWLYGRGVFDMKSVAVAQLRALIALHESGRRPERSVILLATGSEELGSQLGTRWILERHPELAARFWAVLTEGGVVEPKSRTEVKYWGIEFAQKRFADAIACSADRAALEELRETIRAWGEAHRVWRLTEEVAAFLAGYAPSRDSPLLVRLLSDPEATLRQPARFAELPAYLQSTLLDEAVPFAVEEDPDGGHRLRILFHLLPGSDFDEVRERLLPAWMTRHVALTVRPPLGAEHGSPRDHPAFQELVATVEAARPGTRTGPYFVPWSATDSRFFRAAGIPSYGFSPFLIFSTDTYRVDAADERIDLVGFVQGVELYAEAVRRIAG